MKCPADDTVLAISERRGIEIDYCPQCRGVWLDRGELDKLLARAADEVPEPPPSAAYPAYPPTYPPGYQGQQQPYDPRHDPRSDPKYRKKKKSFLSEFLDFDYAARLRPNA